MNENKSNVRHLENISQIRLADFESDYFSKLDPDPHYSEKLGIQVEVKPDLGPQPCLRYGTYLKKVCQAFLC
jgi:hypothetical protein